LRRGQAETDKVNCCAHNSEEERKAVGCKARHIFLYTLIRVINLFTSLRVVPCLSIGVISLRFKSVEDPIGKVECEDSLYVSQRVPKKG
jgi:hypothetical protein